MTPYLPSYGIQEVEAIYGNSRSWEEKTVILRKNLKVANLA